MRLKSNFIQAIVLFSAVSLISLGCGNNRTEAPQDETTEEADSSETTLIKVNDKLFSIPSPIQTAYLIKQTGANYSKDILNPPQKNGSYSSNFYKALNLGVYGADLGYVTMYDQTQDALAYLNSVKKLAEDLGIANAFDKQTQERFQKNLGNRDSLLTLVSIAYRSSDAYLKTNERNEISSLILTGGWVEGLYFASLANKQKSHPEISRRIGEQKTSLQSLIQLLSPYDNQPEYKKLIDSLKDLSTVFDGIEFKYTYIKPSVDADKKTTTINSQTEVKITPEQLESIVQKIQTIRNQIVG